MSAPVEPVQRNALVGQLITLLRANIREGRWPIGSKIPRESELAAAYGVSKTTLRQAVQALVHVGQLETIQGSGTFVRATSEVEAVLGRYLASEDVRPVLELRQAIESYAARLAATRAEPEQLAIMRKAVAAGERAIDDGDEDATAKASIDFHRAVVHASGNAPLIAFYTALEHSVLDSIQRSRSHTTPASFVDGHAQILAAIESRDSQRAHDLANDHLTPTLNWDTESC